MGTATTGGDGQRLVERTRPDVVLLDFVLPDIDGVTVAAALVDRCLGVRVVACFTAWDAQLITRAAIAARLRFVAKSGALERLWRRIGSPGPGRCRGTGLPGRAGSRPAPGGRGRPPPAGRWPPRAGGAGAAGRGKDPRHDRPRVYDQPAPAAGTWRVQSALPSSDRHSQLVAGDGPPVGDAAEPAVGV